MKNKLWLSSNESQGKKAKAIKPLMAKALKPLKLSPLRSEAGGVWGDLPDPAVQRFQPS
jgi:hypothetical protein